MSPEAIASSRAVPMGVLARVSRRSFRVRLALSGVSWEEHLTG